MVRARLGWFFSPGVAFPAEKTEPQTWNAFRGTMPWVDTDGRGLRQCRGSSKWEELKQKSDIQGGSWDEGVVMGDAEVWAGRNSIWTAHRSVTTTGTCRQEMSWMVRLGRDVKLIAAAAEGL
jgi:hypothetical protein